MGRPGADRCSEGAVPARPRLPYGGRPPELRITRVVMESFGHTQISTTMDLYSHVMPAARREAADLMDRILAAEA